MNADEAYRKLGEFEEFPREALQWALDHWDEAAPRFISKLRAYASAQRGSEPDLDALFLVIHLFGGKSDDRVYTPLCALLMNDKAAPEWLGDALTETLPGVLINVCDGDPEPLQRVIESPEADPYARSAALSALAYLVRAKSILSDDEMRAYLQKLNREMKPRAESYMWLAWAFSIAQLGYETLRADVARVFAKGWIDRSDADLDDFHAELQLARSEPDGLAAFHGAGIRPFADIIGTFAQWDADAENEFDDEADSAPIEQPSLNPLRDIGRNDPCPCGSGKKYKKCCLAA